MDDAFIVSCLIIVAIMQMAEHNLYQPERLGRPGEIDQKAGRDPPYAAIAAC